MNIVPCMAWVQRGAAKNRPDRVRLTEDEMSNLVQNMHLAALDDSEEDEIDDHEVTSDPVASDSSRKRKRPVDSEPSEPKEDVDDVSDDDEDEEDEKSNDSNEEEDLDEEENDGDDINKKYGMSDYDDDEEAEEDTGQMKLSGIATFATDKDDPYLQDDAVDSDDEDMQILPDDNLLAIGKVKKDFCGLEVYVYNEKEDNCWCHHDIILPTFPLAMEWLDFDPGEEKAGNFLALGTMAPDIEIWDMDVVDSLEPAFVLAGATMKKNKKKKLKKASSGHTDAVLDLSWNRLQRNALASASADFTIGLWDLEQGKIVSTLEQHKEKVQTLKWHPFEAQSLVSGSFDKTAKVYDCRDPINSMKSWTLPGEVERVMWNAHDPYYFLASSDNGYVYYMDVRASEPVFTLQAHTSAVSGLSFSSSIPNCLVTTCSEGELKIWDIADHKPKQVLQKEMKIGQLHCSVACPDSGLTFAAGGEGDFRIINYAKNPTVAKYFGKQRAAKEEGEDEEEEVPIIGGADEDQDTDDEGLKLSAEAAAMEETEKKKKKKKKGAKKQGEPMAQGVEDKTEDVSAEKTTEKRKKKKAKRKQQA